MGHCALLPQIFLRDDYTNLSTFWQAVRDEIINHVVGLTFQNKTVRLQNPQNHQTIWHIITKKQDLSDSSRFIDINRAAHVPWISFLLSGNCNSCDNYLVWPKRHKGATRWCVYCPEESYIVILEEKGKNELIIITAFIVTPHRAKDLCKEYQNYIKYGI